MDSPRSFAIVPSAGRSCRMGRPKLLLPWDTGTVIEATLKQWKLGGVRHRIVVVHPADAELARVARAAGAEVLIAPTPPDDMKASVALGLAYAAAQWQAGIDDVWLLAPADIPQLSPQVIQQLLEAHRIQPDVILAPVHSGRRGHPVLFPWRFAGEVTRLRRDQGVNALLETGNLCEVAVAEQAADDIDTPDDYRRLHGPNEMSA